MRVINFASHLRRVLVCFCSLCSNRRTVIVRAMFLSGQFCVWQLQCCNSLRIMSASGIWNISEAKFPANGSPREKLGFALKYAMRAPTERHWQAWEFRLADSHVELIASHNPLLEQIDLHEREAVIGCGVSLSHLKLALKHFGCLGRTELFPDFDEPALLARVYTGSGGLRDAQEKLLFETMARQSANQSVSGDASIPDAGLEPLDFQPATTGSPPQ
jgi:hypothetical protein